MLAADFYDVSGSGRNWKALVFQGHNVVDEIEAVSEKQAHFLAQKEYPEAMTPGQINKKLDAAYYSAEGRAWRAKQNR